MKTIKSIFYLLAAVAVGFVAGSCSDDDNYTPGGENGMGIYFSADFPEQVEVTSVQRSVLVPIMRTRTDVPYTIGVLGICNTHPTLFTFPEEVTFAAGEAEQVITVGINGTLEEDFGYSIVLAIGDESQVSNYGKGTLNFDIAIASPWTALGTCLYTDGLIGSLIFGVEPTYEVQIEESGRTPGIYRLIAPYGTNYYNAMYDLFGSDWEAEAGTYTPTNLTIDASDPTQVVLGAQPLGRTLSSFGSISVAGMLATGTLVNNIISFPARSFILELTGATAVNDGQYYGNGNGAFRVALPGAVLVDPQVTVSYQGIYTDTRYNSNAILVFTPSADTESILYKVVEGNISRNAEALAGHVANMLNGTDTEAQTIAVDGSSSTYRTLWPLEVSGEYTVVAVATAMYDGERVTGSNVGYAFNFVGSGEKPESLPLQEGYYLFSTGFDADGNEFFNTIVVSQMDGTQWKVENLYGYPGFMYAEYDETASTLTLSGKANLPTQQGDMDIENFFGMFGFYFDEARTMVIGMFCFPEAISDSGEFASDGTDPWILKVDPTTGNIYETDNYLYDLVGEIDSATDQVTSILGAANITPAGTTVEWTDTPPATNAARPTSIKRTTIAMSLSSLPNLNGNLRMFR